MTEFKMDPYVFYCSKCRIDHGGECMPIKQIIISGKQKEIIVYINEQMKKICANAVWKTPIYIDGI